LIELLVRPSESQKPYAAIVGNHPGSGNYEGFVFQQDRGNQNTFIFTFGDGKQWVPSPRVSLTARRWNYVVVGIRNHTIHVFQNGVWLLRVEIRGVMRNSVMPLHVGNWVLGTRPFHGGIDELRIVNYGLEKIETLNTWQTLKEKKSLSN
jgi:hypothetical protein